MQKPDQDESGEQMKEHPILFSGEMVRAILEGRKTQTRRIARLNAAGRVKLPGKTTNWHCADPNASLACPYGQPGDRLWVRETWAVIPPRAALRKDRAVEYRATHDCSEWHLPDLCPCLPTTREHRWRPSIHMPRWASRILLDVVSVRVERLQSISAEDVEDEGVEIDSERVARMQALAGVDPVDNVRASFACLWDGINANRATWASNPWVWVVEFGRVL